MTRGVSLVEKLLELQTGSSEGSLSWSQREQDLMIRET